MGVPALAANTPSNGYISWGAFSIQFAGVSYIIPAANSGAKYVWWDYDGGGTVEFKRNKIHNPRATISGYAGEYQPRFSWTKSFVTGTDGPTTELNSYTRFTCPANGAGAGRGSDLYGNWDLGSPGTTGDWIKQPVTAGTTITLSGYTRFSEALTPQAGVRFHNGAGGWVGATSVVNGTPAVAGEWQRVSISIVVPATATHVVGRIGQTGTPTWVIGDTQDVTGLMFETSSTLSDYFDGVVAPNDPSKIPSWTGTANNSQSIISTPTPSITDGNVLPSTLTDQDLLLFLNKNGTPVNAQTAQVLEGSLIVEESILTDSLSANSVTGEKILAGSVDATKIAAHTITSDQIEARSITADSLAIADFTNYAQNPYFDYGADGWIASSADWNVQVANLTSINNFVARSSASGAVGASNLLNNFMVEVREGVEFNVSGVSFNTGGAVVQVGLRFFDEAGAPYIDSVTTLSGAQGTWTGFDVNITTPANAYYTSLIVKHDGAGTLRISNLEVHHRFGGELIVDGAIEAGHLSANSVTAGKIAAGAVTAVTLAAGAVTATAIAADSITAGQIAAGAIGASEIAANAIYAGAIQANAVTANAIAANAVTANKLNIVMGGGNLFANSSFENSASLPAGTNGATVVTETGTAANVYRGARSIKVTLPTLGANGTGVSLHSAAMSTGLPIKPNTTYTLSAWFKNPSVGGLPGGFLVNVQGPNVVSASSSAAMTATDAWVRASTTFTTNSNGLIPALYVLNAVAATAGQFFYLGAAQLEEGDVGTAYSPRSDEILPGTIVANMLAVNSVTAAAISAGAISASALAANSVTASAIAAFSIDASKIAANSITATAIAANAVTASAIVAGAITTDKLSILAFGENRLPNGNFEEGLLNWTIGETNGTATVVTGQSFSGSSALRLLRNPGAGSGIEVRSRLIPTSPLEVHYVGAMAKSASAMASGLYLRVMWYQADGVTAASTSLNDIIANGSLTTTYVQKEGQVVAPGNAAFMQVRLYNTLVHATDPQIAYIDEVILRRITEGVMIRDGAITAAKIAAQSITATALAANAITATAIAAKSISTSKLVISDYTNLIEDPGFELGGSGWTLGTGATIVTPSSVPVGGTKALQHTANAIVIDTPYIAMPVSPGDVWYAEAYVRKTTTGVVGTLQLAATVTLDGASPQYPSATSFGINTLTQNTWLKVSGRMVMPAGCNTLILRLSTRNDVPNGDIIQWDNIVLRRAASAELIVDGAITAVKIGAAAVDATKIAAQSITATALAAASITATAIAAQAIRASAIAAGNIMATAIGAQQINASHLSANSITATAITAGNILASAIGAQQINATHLSAQSITATALAAQSITATAIAAAAIRASAIAAGNIMATAIGAQQINATHLSANSVTATAITAGNILASAIGAQQINATHLSAQSITATAISAGAILASSIAAGAIAATAIGALQINASHISAGAITATAIAANAVRATSIAAGEINATHLSANSITATAIAAATIRTDKLTIGSFDNLISDPTFLTPLSASGPWPITAGWTRQTGASRSGGPVLRLTASASDQFIINDASYYYPVDTVSTPLATPASYFVSAMVKTSTVNNGGIALGARWLLSTGATVSGYTGADIDADAGVWTRYMGTLSAPASAVGVQFLLGATSVYTSGTVDFDYFGATRAGTSELIVNGSIRAENIAAEQINATHLEVGTLEAGFTLTGALAIADPNGGTPAITMSPGDGIRVEQPDGDAIVFPADGTAARVGADLIAYSLNVKDDLTVNGFGKINGDVQLSSGVPNPTIAPYISQEWPTYTSVLGNGSTNIENVFHGLCAHHSNSALYAVGVNAFGTAGIRMVDKTSNTYIIGAYPDPTNGQAWTSNFYITGGITFLSGHYYVMGTDNNRSAKTYVYRINATTWVKNAEVEFTVSGLNGYRTRLFTDGTNIGVVYTLNNGGMYARIYSSALSTLLSTYALLTSMGAQAHVGDAWYGNSGTGSNMLHVALYNSNTYPNVMMFNPASSYVRVTTNEFKRANNGSISGMHYDSGSGLMVSYSGTGLFSIYSDFVTGVNTIQAAYTFYDGDTSGSTITHETAFSPTRTYVIDRRAWPVFETQPPPDEKVLAAAPDKANRIGIYFTYGATLYRHAYLTNTSGVAQRVVRGVLKSGFPTTDPTPLDNFGSVIAKGSISSQVTGASGWQFLGDGTWSAGAFDSTQGVWQAYTPTTTVGSTGSGAKSGRWCRIGGTIHFNASYVLGTGFNMTGIQLTLPVPAQVLSGYGTNIGVRLIDNGTLAYHGNANFASSGVAIAPVGIGLNGGNTTVTATVPFTWVVGDIIAITGTYEAA